LTTLPNEGFGPDSYPGLGTFLSLGSHAVFNYTPASPYNNQLWSTDGTAAGTINLSTSAFDNPVIGLNGLLSGGRLAFTDVAALSVTDGTIAGTFQLKAGSFGHGSYPFGLATLGSIVVFGVASGPAFNDAAGGDQLWRTDGTQVGTVLIENLPRLSVYAGLTSIESFGSKALFAYEDGTGSFIPGLWVTDGTSAGTFAIPSVMNPRFGITANGLAFMVTADGLVATDGTIAGTNVIMPKSLGPNGFGPTTIMAQLGNKVIFAAGIPTQLNGPYILGPDNQLWITDGTSAGTKLIATLPINGSLAGIGSMTSTGDHVLFTYYDGAAAAVWSTDGTSDGTAVLIDNGGGLFSASLSPTPTIVVDNLVPPCFARGTRIATPRGDRRVEHLQVNDVVLTVTGSNQIVRWIGHRRVDCRRHPDRDRVRPIRIEPHAFGMGRPKRPLMLSPDHSIYVEDVLIPIKFLINGTTIKQIEVDEVTYFHVELSRHDILIADGLPAESYLETGGRAAFDNAGTIVELQPNFGTDQSRVADTWRDKAYAPLLGEGDQFSRALAKLHLQAMMLATCAEKQTRRKRAA
jgi:hypothetical protein